MYVYPLSVYVCMVYGVCVCVCVCGDWGGGGGSIAYYPLNNLQRV